MAGRWRGEQGSTWPLLAVLLGVAVLVAAAAIEREWANAMQRLAETTADFAAEAAAQYHQVYARVRAHRYHYEQWQEWVCQPLADPDEEPKCQWETRQRRVHDVVERELSERELRRQGPAPLFGCQGDPYAGWVCLRYEVLARRLEFAEAAEAVAEQVFQANWVNRPRAAVREVQVIPWAAARQVQVVVALDLESLFGFWPISHRVLVRGAAGVRLEPLRL